MSLGCPIELSAVALMGRSLRLSICDRRLSRPTELDLETVNAEGGGTLGALVDGSSTRFNSASIPTRCDAVFAVIDTASKTGTDNDATAVTFFAYDTLGKISLFILDWDVVQIEGAMLETWLPQVFARLEELARLCHARRGSIGAFIEDKNSGTILLQQALRRQMLAHPIDSKLTAMGKDERAISVSGYERYRATSGRALSCLDVAR
jgi:hypothetical protein